MTSATHAFPRTLLLACLLAAGCEGDGTPPVADGGDDAGVPPADGGGPLDDPLGRAGAWDDRFTIAGLSGADGIAPQVYDFARGPDGDVRAVGYFHWLGSERVDPFLRRTERGWEPAHDAFSESVPAGGFSAVAIGPAGELALAEYSGPFGGSRSYALWLEDGTGLRTIGRFQGTVRSLAWFGGQLWVGGFFALENGVQSLAVWDGSSLQAPPGGAVDGPVYELRASDEELLVAGGFSEVGGTAAKLVAGFDGTTWTAYDLDGFRAFTVLRDDDGELYAGGTGLPGGVMHYVAGAWQPLGGGVHQADEDGAGVVSTLALHQGALFAAGCFRAAGGDSEDTPRITVDSIARFDGTRWQPLEQGGAPIASSFFQFGVCGFEPNEFSLWDMAVQRLASDGERLYVGGSFPGIAGHPSQSLVAYDGAHFVAEGSAGDGLMGSAQSVALGGPDASPHVFGGITHAGDVTSPSGVFRFDDGWSPVGGALPAGLGCTTTAGGHGLAVAPDGTMYLACSREDQSAPPPCPDCPPIFPAILKQDGDAWIELPLDQPGAPDDLAIDRRGRLWAVGGLRTGDATGAGWVARLDGDRFTVVEDGFDSMVFRIAFGPERDGEVVPLVGGSFTHVGDTSCPRIARAVGAGWEPVGDALTTAVLALAATSDGTIYAATAAESAAYTILGRWDGRAWTELATPANGLPAPPPDGVHQVNALAVVGPRLLVGGSLLPDHDAATPFEAVERTLFVFDGTRFSALGGGLKASSVDSLAVSAEGAWFVGSLLAEAGNGDTLRSSVGVAHWIFGE